MMTDSAAGEVRRIMNGDAGTHGAVVKQFGQFQRQRRISVHIGVQAFSVREFQRKGNVGAIAVAFRGGFFQERSCVMAGHADGHPHRNRRRRALFLQFIREKGGIAFPRLPVQLPFFGVVVIQEYGRAHRIVVHQHGNLEQVAILGALSRFVGQVILVMGVLGPVRHLWTRGGGRDNMVEPFFVGSCHAVQGQFIHGGRDVSGYGFSFAVLLPAVSESHLILFRLFFQGLHHGVIRFSREISLMIHEIFPRCSESCRLPPPGHYLGGT